MEVADLRIPLAGRSLPLDLSKWGAQDRFAVGVTLAGVVLALVVVGVVALSVVPGIVPMVLFALAALVAIIHGVVDFMGFRAAPPASTVAPRVPLVTLRCAECNTVFDLEDPGFRPLYHVCPGCGTHGVLEAAAPPPPAALDYSRPPMEPPRPAEPAPMPLTKDMPPPPAAFEPEPAPPPEAPPASAPPVAAPPAKPRRIKHTCKQCGNVRILTDDGTRPFVTTCEKCGRSAKLALG